MGMAMSVPQLLIILVIVALIFGTKRLKDLGGDLGGALRSFRKAMNTGDSDADEASVPHAPAEPPKRLPAGEREQTLAADAEQRNNK